MKKQGLKPFKLGTYQLGHQWVDVWLNPATRGGDFNWDHDDKRNLRITVGIESPNRWQAYGTLLHEAIEELLDNHRLRFKNASTFGDCTDGYTFVMNHSQFTEVCARAGVFMEEVLDDFNKAWAQHHK